MMSFRERFHTAKVSGEGRCKSPGGHCWDYYPGTLSSMSRHCNSFENRVPVDFSIQSSSELL